MNDTWTGNCATPLIQPGQRLDLRQLNGRAQSLWWPCGGPWQCPEEGAAGHRGRLRTFR